MVTSLIIRGKMKIVGKIKNIFSEGAPRPTAGDEPCEFFAMDGIMSRSPGWARATTSHGEGGRVPPFIEKLRKMKKKLLILSILVSIGLVGWTFEQFPDKTSLHDWTKFGSYLRNFKMPINDSSDSEESRKFNAWADGLGEMIAEYRQDWNVIAQREKNTLYRRSLLYRQHQILSSKEKRIDENEFPNSQAVLGSSRQIRRVYNLLKEDLERIESELQSLTTNKLDLMVRFAYDQDRILQASSFLKQ